MQLDSMSLQEHTQSNHSPTGTASASSRLFVSFWEWNGVSGASCESNSRKSSKVGVGGDICEKDRTMKFWRHFETDEPMDLVKTSSEEILKKVNIN
jgi:hypothetical protein